MTVLSEERWSVLRLGRGPTGRWVAVPPSWGGEWQDVSFFGTQPEAFKYAFEECTDRRELFGVLVNDRLVCRGSCADMEALALDWDEHGEDTKLVVQIRGAWVQAWP